MKRAVIEFPQARSKRLPAEGRRRAAGVTSVTSIDILTTLNELRADLRSIENAILAVESLAIAEFGKDALRTGIPVLRKEANAAPEPKTRLIVSRRSPQSQFEFRKAEAD